MRLYVGVGTIVERHAAGSLKGPLRTLGIARGNGIDAVGEQSSAFRGLQARRGKANR